MRQVTVMLLVLALSLFICSCSRTDNKKLSFDNQYNLGIRYLNENNYKEAIIAFTKAIEIEPKSAPAHIGLADAYAGSEDLENAITNYEIAIELDNDTPDAYIKLADIYIKNGDTDKAVEVLQQGYDATGDGLLSRKMEEMKPVVQESVSNPSVPSDGEQSWFSGTLMINSDIYGEKTQKILSEGATFNSIGLFLDVQQSIEVEGKVYSVSELNVYYGSNVVLNQSINDYMGKHVSLKGNVIFVGEGPELTTRTDNTTGKTEQIMSYMMNGPLAILVDELSVSD